MSQREGFSEADERVEQGMAPGEPVTVTDEDVARYLVTPEVVEEPTKTVSESDAEASPLTLEGATTPEELLAVLRGVDAQGEALANRLTQGNPSPFEVLYRASHAQQWEVHQAAIRIAHEMSLKAEAELSRDLTYCESFADTVATAQRILGEGHVYTTDGTWVTTKGLVERIGEVARSTGAERESALTSLRMYEPALATRLGEIAASPLETERNTLDAETYWYRYAIKNINYEQADKLLSFPDFLASFARGLAHIGGRSLDTMSEREQMLIARKILEDESKLSTLTKAGLEAGAAEALVATAYLSPDKAKAVREKLGLTVA
jgi:hypothetical protein